jgi:hypothetical protein
MIAPPKAAKGGVFRLALAPSIVNPRVNRVWLVPIDGVDRAVAPSSFDPIIDEFREILIALGKHDLEIRGMLAEDVDDYCKSVWVWGGRIHPEIDGQVRHIELYVVGLDQDIARRFHNAGACAGALIPNRIRDAVHDLFPNTAFAWWIAAAWEFSTIKPEVSLGWSPERPEECGGMGVYWDDPIAASISAIEAAGLIGPDPAKLATLQGEWTVPMSKTEFARRILQKRGARSREADPIWGHYEKIQHGPNTWTFRLDTLPPETRRKLDGGKP